MSQPTTADTTRVSDPDVPSAGRELSIVGYIVIVVVYVGVLKLANAGSTAGLDDTEYATFTDRETVLRQLIIPVGISAIFAAAVVTWLGWWASVLSDHRPVRRWVWFVPGIMIATVVLGTAYPDLFDQTFGFVVLLLAGALLVGFAEETMFRGIGVTAFRARGFRETRVALWTSVVFGMVHASNLLIEGPSAFLQVFSTAAAGFFFYLVLRVTGTLAAAIVIHGLWDFGLFTGNITDDVYLLTTLFVLTQIILAVVLLVGARKIGVPWPHGSTERYN